MDTIWNFNFIKKDVVEINRKKILPKTVGMTPKSHLVSKRENIAERVKTVKSQETAVQSSRPRI